ncbi:MAG: hypothetical protein IKS35_04980 [Clostridia bacterium]|nr:hypothetical protein [Clostridia bacterium]
MQSAPENTRPFGATKALKLNMPVIWKVLFSALLLADSIGFCLLYAVPAAGPYVLIPLAILSIVAMSFRTRDLSAGVAMIIPAAAFWLLSGSYVPAALWVLLLTLVGLGAYLLRCLPVWQWLFIPVLAAGIGALVSGGALLAILLCLFAFPAAYALYAAVAGARSKVGAIVMVAGALLLTLIALVLIALYLRHGKLDRELLQTIVDTYRTELSAQLKATLDTQLSVYQSVGYEVAIDSASYAAQITDAVFNLVPGILVLFSLVVGWCVQPIPYILHIRTDPEAVLPLNARAFSLSPMTAIVFLICQIPTFFVDIASSLATIVMANLALILFPGLALLGLGSFFTIWDLRRGRARKGGSPKGFIVFMVLVLSLAGGCSFAYYILLIAAFYGSYTILFTAIRSLIPKRPRDDD